MIPYYQRYIYLAYLCKIKRNVTQGKDQKTITSIEEVLYQSFRSISVHSLSIYEERFIEYPIFE